MRVEARKAGQQGARRRGGRRPQATTWRRLARDPRDPYNLLLRNRLKPLPAF